ncbi:type II methionyl aminopeptidase [Candidatus Bathyarchaeota archaeon]|nr:MAG: type II methionyl aminopeptidase [Candidatus Bathyarchaeota archaeon]
MTELSREILEKYEEAGRIASKVRERMKSIVKEGMKIIEICEEAEEAIRRMGGKPAFPCNVSVNEVAAHYTSPPEDERVIPRRSVVKIDVGVHIDGYIADTAVTVCFNPDYEEMVQTSQVALETAIRTIRPGISISELGSKIQSAIERRGFKPISNLTGHQIGRYMIHAGKSLPNVSTISFRKVREGEVYAIEPFVTTLEAEGRVMEGREAHIYRILRRKNPKMRKSRRLLRFLERNFRTLPFAKRWLKRYGLMDESAFTDLLESRCLMAYPVFIEASGEWVAQSEHTVYMSKNGPIVLT